MLAQIAKSVGTGERTLRRAISDGTIHVVPGNTRPLLVTAEEAEYVRLHWNELGTLRRLLRTEPNVGLAVVFGSFARGEEEPDSDLDLVVSLRRPESLGLERLRERMQSHLRRPLQLIALADVERSSSMMYEVIRDGRVLVDREGRWAALQARRGSVARAARAEGRRIEDEARRAIEHFSALAQQS
ncbi:nucleotidyltransferase domain-containing protein [Baekduia sp.]|jgi:predicted nucleotidyltransferase|uniref:nucleotidyltransferase domain-containing protein n=1 Tax=Baekduia sp. TaxID=2600305 RepID=UPI002DFFB19F|nr:nucleotidyltransferase domain-containing protein [Baekduia sp.]